ncbi:MAG: adenylyltransferase/cytidyltransferase family protein [Actinomycetota bacterium]
MIRGYTTGVYDMFHVGHLNLLRKAREHCDHLIVGVTSDEIVRERKGKSPIIPFDERFDIVRSIRFVDEVVVQSDMDKFRMWEHIGFDRVFVGDDWKGTPQWDAYERQFAEVDVDVVYFPYTEGTSSTKLAQVLDDRLADT